jgi:hypothetical protein
MRDEWRVTGDEKKQAQGVQRTVLSNIPILSLRAISFEP